MSLHDDLPIFERPQAVRLVVYVIGEGQPDRFGHDDAASEMQHRRDPVFREDVVDEMSIACIADHQWHARRYDLRISGRPVAENDHITAPARQGEDRARTGIAGATGAERVRL